MRGRVWVTLTVLLLAASLPALGSTFVHISQSELVSQADTLIQGRVMAVDSFWSEDGRMIITEATIEVRESLLGAAPEVVTVRTFGGQVGEMRVEASGFPTFSADEEVLLFLKAEPADGSLRVLGYQEGHFQVVTRQDGVTLAVPMVEDGVRFLSRSGGVAPEPQSVEIGQFKNGVRATARSVGREYKSE